MGPVSETNTTANVDARCEGCDTDVDVLCVAPSAFLVSSYEEPVTEGVDVCEESKIVADTPVAEFLLCCTLTSVSEKTSAGLDVCEKLNAAVVAEIVSLQNFPGGDAVLSEPMTSLTDIGREDVMRIVGGRARRPCYSCSRLIRARYKRRLY